MIVVFLINSLKNIFSLKKVVTVFVLHKHMLVEQYVRLVQTFATGVTTLSAYSALPHTLFMKTLVLRNALLHI